MTMGKWIWHACLFAALLSCGCSFIVGSRPSGDGGVDIISDEILDRDIRHDDPGHDPRVDDEVSPSDWLEDVPPDHRLDMEDPAEDLIAEEVRDVEVIEEAWDTAIEESVEISDPDSPEDIAPDSDIEPGPELPWGDTVCGATGRINDCSLLCLTPVVYTNQVTLPSSLTAGKIMRVEIELLDRFMLGDEQPFIDLEVSLTSPAGTKITFWKYLYGTNSWETNYGFISLWLMPFCWDEVFGGTWTLEIEDWQWTGTSSTLNAFCLTPLDPADHSGLDTGAHMQACSTASHEITDFCHGDAPDPCLPHPVQAELQVNDLVRASTAPTLTIAITHPDPSELVIAVRTSYGEDITVWDRATESLPPSFALATHAGNWMTGRWALIITDNLQNNIGTLGGWCLEAN